MLTDQHVYFDLQFVPLCLSALTAAYITDTSLSSSLISNVLRPSYTARFKSPYARSLGGELDFIIITVIIIIIIIIIILISVLFTVSEALHLLTLGYHVVASPFFTYSLHFFYFIKPFILNCV